MGLDERDVLGKGNLSLVCLACVKRYLHAMLECASKADAGGWVLEYGKI